MSNIFKLVDLQEKAHEEFADMTIAISDERSITLLNILRLDEAQRDEIQTYFSELSPTAEVDEDGEIIEPEDEKERATMFDIIAEILRRVTADRADGDLLVDKIVGNDKPLLLVIFNQWTKRTQAGEA